MAFKVSSNLQFCDPQKTKICTLCRTGEKRRARTKLYGRCQQFSFIFQRQKHQKFSFIFQCYKLRFGDNEEVVITLPKVSYYLVHNATKFHQQVLDISIFQCTFETTSNCKLSNKLKLNTPYRPNFSSFSDRIQESQHIINLLL